MFCLLCHEKIPRLRAWRTKSEFCCDEHAELYKKQTLERLLTDQENSKPNEAPPLPIEASRPSGKHAADEVPSHAQSILARFAEEKPAAKPPLPLPEPVQKPSENRDAGVQELWRLAEEVGNSDVDSSDEDWGLGSHNPVGRSKSKLLPLRGSGGGSSNAAAGNGPHDQSPEEALAALRAIASNKAASPSKSLPSRALVKDEDDLAPQELDAAEEVGTPAVQELNLAASEMDDLSADFDSGLDDDALLSLDPHSLAPLDEDELPSIFERLTESSGGYSGLHEMESDQADMARPEIVEAQTQEAVQLEAAATIEDPALFDETPSLDDLAALEEVPFAPELDAAISAAEPVRASAPQVVEDIVETPAARSGGLDLLAEAVEAHLEPPREKPSKPELSRKVLPFPTPRVKPPVAPEPEKIKPAPERIAADPVKISAPAAPEKVVPVPEKVAVASEKIAAAPQKPLKTKRPGDASRLQMKPVASLMGLEPAISEPQGSAFHFAAAHDAEQIAEPAMNYPGTQSAQGRTRRNAVRLPLAARLWIVIPNNAELPPAESESGYSSGPSYTEPCDTPRALAADIDLQYARSLPNPRTRFAGVEPALQDSLPFEFKTIREEAEFSHLELPAAILSGAAPANGSTRLDLSGADGCYQPSADRAFLLMPEISEVDAAEGKAHGWIPPTVLDPRFEIERPVGRDLSDFG